MEAHNVTYEVNCHQIMELECYEASRSDCQFSANEEYKDTYYMTLQDVINKVCGQKIGQKTVSSTKILQEKR